MPWPFDKYKRPAAAQYWLSKAPKTSAEQDQYPEEFIYLDELEERIENFHELHENSPKFDAIYNEYGWEDHLPVTKGYPTLGKGKNEARHYGRGNKINPAHYIGPEFQMVSRLTLPAIQHMPINLVRNHGALRGYLELPPEEPSVFKFWNAYQISGMAAIVLVSKEIFMIEHDIVHAMFFWGGLSAITALCIDWWMWWQALRSQEFYDRKFFPLNEKVEKLYQLLEDMEKKGSEKQIVLAAQVYGQKLSEQMLKHGMLAKKIDMAYELQDQMKLKASKEASEVNEAQGGWKRDSMAVTEKFFQDPKVGKDYMKSALANLAKGDNAMLRAATDAAGVTSTVFADKYNTNFNTTKDKYLKDQRAAGTLPWGFASDAEKKAKGVDKAKIQADVTAALRKDYPTFRPA